jgi:uncharacterized coiled-coil protein SlyX
MVDAAYAGQRRQEDDAAVRVVRRQLIIPLVVAFVLIGAGLTVVWAFGGNKVVAPPPGVPTASATNGRAADELLETTKGLEVTQQQAVDQLQVVQDQLAAQQAETRKLSDEMATLHAKLDALQQSVANIPSPSAGPAISAPKSVPTARASRVQDPAPAPPALRQDARH